MGRTNIEWSDAVWNPASGCSKVSAGCRFCYAEREWARLSGNPKLKGYFGRKFTDVRCHPERLDAPLHWRKPRRIFVNSMSDLFHEDVPDEFIDRVFAVMALAPRHTCQVLTKRPERMRGYCRNEYTPFRIARAMDALRSADLGDEEFRPIDDYPGYFVSSHGFIYSEKRGHRQRMKPDVSDQGYQRVQLHRDGKTNCRGDRLLVHRLVLEAFVGPTPTSDTQGCHRDGNPSNNAVSNLSWGDRGANWDDSKRHGTHRHYSKLTSDQAAEIRRRRDAGENAAALGREFGISDTQVRNIGTGKQWNVGAPIEWPLANCWFGVSVENREQLARLDILRKIPNAMPWVSFEPLLEDLGDLSAYSWLKWAVWGGESGPKARPCNVEWIRKGMRQLPRTAHFVKQLGSQVSCDPKRWTKGWERWWQEDHGEAWGGGPILRNRKGADPAEWMEDLRVREYPR